MTESEKMKVAILLYNLLLESEREFCNLSNKIREVVQEPN